MEIFGVYKTSKGYSHKLIKEIVSKNEISDMISEIDKYKMIEHDGSGLSIPNKVEHDSLDYPSMISIGIYFNKEVFHSKILGLISMEDSSTWDITFEKLPDGTQMAQYDIWDSGLYDYMIQKFFTLSSK